MTTLPDVVIDHHVHLGLIDVGQLPGLSGVVDLGWSLTLSGSEKAACNYLFAGQFIAAPGGYPSDRSWAPPGSVREVQHPHEAEAAVAQQLASGAALIKVTLHADAGPVLSLACLRAVVACAGAVPVVAHAEGAGMVQLALDGGVDALAHTPWTEELADELIAECAARQRWISTLDIHGYGTRTPQLHTALSNLRRFVAAGGQVLYGTDLGNGPLPQGVNHREIALLAEAGVTGELLRAAVSDPWPQSTREWIE